MSLIDTRVFGILSASNCSSWVLRAKAESAYQSFRKSPATYFCTNADTEEESISDKSSEHALNTSSTSVGKTRNNGENREPNGCEDHA